MKNLLLATAATLFATSAFAADMPMASSDAAVVEASDWSGFYAGVHLGYGFGNFDFSDVPDTDHYAGLDLDDEDGLFGGGQIGYNIQSGAWLFGVEGDIAATGIHPEDPSYGLVSVNAEIGFIATARGRVGYAFGDVAIYATGGAAFLDVDANYGIDSDDDLAMGWTAGGGIEGMITENISAKLEYLFIDATAENLALSPDTDIDIELHTIKAGLNYHF